MILPAFDLDLAIVTPLANESSTVDQFLEEILQLLPARSAVFCVVDQSSADDTRSRVEAWVKWDSRVRCLWVPENRCVVDAYVCGYREALRVQARWILEMDGGFAHLPSQIPLFLGAMATGIDFAAGSRFTHHGRFLAPLRRRVLSQGGTFLANRMLGTRMSDMTSGFECFSHRALTAVLERGLRSRAHFFQTEIRYLLHAWKWMEVPIEYRNTVAHVPFQSVRESMSNLLWLRRQKQLPPPEEGSH